MLLVPSFPGLVLPMLKQGLIVFRSYGNIICDYRGFQRGSKEGGVYLFPGRAKRRGDVSPLRLRGLETLREALIKSTCADLRQKFLLTRKKIAGILTDFKIF
jgi:hypothetical protein